MAANNRLSTHVYNAIAKIDGVVRGFDRISFWVDHPMPKFPRETIARHCGKIVVTENRAYQYQPLWQCRVDLFQPDKLACQLLATAVEDGRYRTRPHYAEIALDLITATEQHADEVRDFLLAHLLVPYARENVVCERNTTFYFHRRANTQGHKTPHAVALYSDQPSKLAGLNPGHHCCHLEHRFSSSSALAGIGIACASDFPAFSHKNFWNSQMKLACLPKKTDLGRFLLADKDERSGTALRKRADRFLAPYYVHGSFVLQNLRMAHPEVSEVLTPLENSLLLGQT